ncbi:hypothetical protein AMTRI_Chr06g176310 [Amborella trichopoda]
MIRVMPVCHIFFPVHNILFLGLLLPTPGKKKLFFLKALLSKRDGGLFPPSLTFKKEKRRHRGERNILSGPSKQGLKDRALCYLWPQLQIAEKKQSHDHLKSSMQELRLSLSG